MSTQPNTDPLRIAYPIINEIIGDLSNNSGATRISLPNTGNPDEPPRIDMSSDGYCLCNKIPMISNPLVFQNANLLSLTREQGFSLNFRDGPALSVGTVNAMDYAQRGSEHELRLLFYSPLADGGSLNKDASCIFGGVAASYQTPRFETEAGGKVFLGGGFDATLDENNLWMLHMYAGFPIYAGGSVAHDYWWYPYWEVGFMRVDDSGKLVLGLSATASLFSPDDANDHYIGLSARYEY